MTPSKVAVTPPATAPPDPVNAQGCKTWFSDADQDGYGSTTSQCACGPMGLFTASKSGDCNDQSPQQEPGATEICNGLDDNCKGGVDEGPGAQLCPSGGGSAVVCQGGKCALQCSGKPFDVDGNYGNGCECTADGNYGVSGGACTAAMDVGRLSDAGSVAQRQGNVMPGEAGNWYGFKAVDTPDSGGACDKFHVKAPPSGPGAGQGTSAGAVVKSPAPETEGSAGASCGAYTLRVSNGL